MLQIGGSEALRAGCVVSAIIAKSGRAGRRAIPIGRSDRATLEPADQRTGNRAIYDLVE